MIDTSEQLTECSNTLETWVNEGLKKTILENFVIDIIIADVSSPKEYEVA